MSYTHGRDNTLEGRIVHTSQTNVKGTIKEHRNFILESRCKSKRSGTLSEPSGNFEGTDATWEHSTWISPASKSVGDKCLAHSKLSLCL